MASELVNWLLALSGLGCLTVAVLHSVLGERLVVQPILERMNWSGLPISAGFAQRTLRLAWHLTSVICLGAAAILVSPIAGLHGARPAYVIAAATFGVAFLMAGVGSRWRHRAWPFFAIITLALSTATVLSGTR